jgi:Na+/serine symporter
MPALTAPAPESEAFVSLPPMLSWDALLGVALFDTSGLPREYFVTEHNRTTHWVQVVFQALGLRSLLASSLQLEGFQQTIIQLKDTAIVVIRRRHDYLALRVKATALPAIQRGNQDFAQWVYTLDSRFFQQHPHFIAA